MAETDKNKEVCLSADDKEELNTRIHELGEQLNFLQRVTDEMPAIAYLFDIQDLTMIWCNKRHKKLVGFDTTGMKLLNEKNNLRAITPDDQHIAKQNIKGWKEKLTDPSHVIIRITDQEGGEHYFMTNHEVFKQDENGNPKWVLGIGVNVSQPVGSEHEKRILYSEDITKTYKLLEQFSDREIEVLKSLSDGLSYEKIAHNMNLSVDGIRYHIRNIYQKLEVNSRAEAIKKAMKYRLFNP